MQLNFGDLNLKGKTIGVAVSGGSDSVVLLHALKTFSESHNFNIVVINVEHGIRGESSVKDSEFVKNLANDLKIEFYGYKVNAVELSKKDGVSLETAARSLRYNCFEDALKKGYCDYIATAHHQADKIESILLNVLRGTGIAGLSGIKPRRDRFIRPLIDVSKKELEDYIKEYNLKYVTDESNFMDDCSRNYLRLNIIPKLKEAFPSFESAILRLSDLAEADNNFIESIAESFVFGPSVKIPCPAPVFARAVMKALKNIGFYFDYEKTHVDALYSLALCENGKRINLPHGVTAYKEYDKITFSKTLKSFEDIHFFTGEFEFENGSLLIEETTDTSSGYYADFDKFPKSAVIRTRKNGDVFTKFGGGTKSLGDIFTDKKVPLRLRDSLPIIADGNNVLFVSTIGISDCVKVDNQTVKIVKLEYRQKKEQ